MSDGRTTYEHEPPDDEVQKFVTYSHTTSGGDGLDPDDFRPGKFAAVLMVQNRASFNPIGRPQREHRTLAAQVVEEFLQSTGPQYEGVSALGNSVWAAIERRWVESCEGCRVLAGERLARTDRGEVCEHENYDDGGFTLLIAAVNDRRYSAGPVRYVRERLNVSVDETALVNREIHFSGPRGVQKRHLRHDVAANHDEELLAEMTAAFRVEARNPNATGAWAEWAGKIGGKIRTVVLDPNSGFRTLRTFDLDGRLDP